jgi:DNA-binding NarL/FixJ family response regulator
VNHPISVLIADDQDLVREGLRMLLEAEPDITVAGEAGTGIQAIAAARRLDPDVVLMDVRMPDMDGIEATVQLVRVGSRARILMLTTFDLDNYVYQAMRAGASGFLLKDASPGQLATAIRTVSAGGALLAPPITRRLIEDFCRRPPPDGTAAEPAQLSQRELDVVQQVAQGRSNAEIAGQLYLSEATVKSHIARTLAKLGLRDRVQIVIFAYETGITQPGQSSHARDRKPQPGQRS